MIPIPGFVISILTFPGVIVHEFAHFLFCKWFRVAVFEVCFFRFDNPAGYVIHEIPRHHWQQVMIGIGPFFINTILGALIGFPAAFAIMGFGSSNPLDYVLMYFGVSIAMHAFPSTGDAESIWQSLGSAPAPVKIIATPLVGLIYLGAFGSIIWLDLLYGIGVVNLGAKLIVNCFA